MTLLWGMSNQTELHDYEDATMATARSTVDGDEQATIRAPVDTFTSLIERCALDGQTEHSELYLNILDDHIEVLQAAPGEIVLTYGSFSSSHFDDLTLEKEEETIKVDDGSGGTMEYQKGCEAIIDVERTLQYLNYASSSGTVELSFSGEEDIRLSTMLRAEGALEAWVNLPGSQDILDHVPLWLPSRYNEDEKFTSTGGNPTPTIIKTQTHRIQKIIDIVQADVDDTNYPIVVNEGDFEVDVGESHSSGVRGQLKTNSVEGPDVENYYFSGFEEIFNVLSGTVELQTAPENSPISVVQRGNDGDVVRHVNGSIKP